MISFYLWKFYVNVLYWYRTSRGARQSRWGGHLILILVRIFHFLKNNKAWYEILTSNEIPSKRPIFVYSHLWNIYIVLSTDLHVLSVKSDALRVRYEKGWLDLDINIHFLQFRQAHTPDLSFSNGEYLFPKCATRLVT